MPETTARRAGRSPALAWDYPTLDGSSSATRISRRCSRRSTAIPSPMVSRSGTSPPCETMGRPPAVAGSTPGSCPRPGAIRRAAQGRRQGVTGVGLLVAGQPAPAVQPGLSRSTGEPPGASARSGSGGMLRRVAGRAMTPGFPADEAGVQTGAGGQGARRARRGLAVREHGGWQRLALRRLGGCAIVPFPTHYEPFETPVHNLLYPQQPAKPRPGTSPARQPVPRGGGRAVPLRHHHLPSHRAPHRRRHEPLGTGWPSCSQKASWKLARSSPSPASTTALGDPFYLARRGAGHGESAQP